MIHILSLFLLATSGWSLEGTFKAEGDFEHLQKKTTEVVFNQSQDGRDRINELLTQGFHCSIKGRFHRCIHNEKTFTLPADIKIKHNHEILTFMPITATEEIAKAENFYQYLADQEVWVDKRQFFKTMYTETKDFDKLQVGLDKGPLYFIIEDQSVTAVQTYKKKESRWRWTDYLVTVFYQPQS